MNGVAIQVAGWRADVRGLPDPISFATQSTQSRANAIVQSTQGWMIPFSGLLMATQEGNARPADQRQLEFPPGGKILHVDHPAETTTTMTRPKGGPQYLANPVEMGADEQHAVGRHYKKGPVHEEQPHRKGDDTRPVVAAIIIESSVKANFLEDEVKE